MAGNALPLVLLAGAAFLLTRNKGGTGTAKGGIPEGQGQGSQDDKPSDEPADDPGGFSPDFSYDASMNMPWVETVGDYQQWMANAEAMQGREWIGGIEFRDMDEVHAELGITVEEIMGAFGKTAGRTVDRAEVDPEAKEAMAASQFGVIEKGVDEVFADVPGLDFIIFFIRDALPPKLAVFFGFDSNQSQGAAMSKIANFKSEWESALPGLQVSVQAGYIGQSGPTIEEKIKAFLNSTLPLKVDIAGSGGGSIQGSLNP